MVDTGGLTLATLAGACTLALAFPAAAQNAVGTAGAVNPAATGGTRVLQLGSPIIYKERIQTTDRGSVQVIFVDKTTLNVGPNSDLTIDQFVYDANAGTGTMAVSLAKGVMRLVGGQATHDLGATVKTPVATIGIRGGIATISHSKAKGTKATNLYGTMTVEGLRSDLEVVRRPNFSVTVAGPGQSPSQPVPVSQTELAEINSQLTSKPLQVGGATSIPNDAIALNSGLGTANIGGPQLDFRDQPAAAPAGAADGRFARNAAQQASKVLFTARAAAAAQPRAFALTTSADPALGSGVPYLLGTFATKGAYRISSVLGYKGADGTSQTVQAALSINGQGPGQTSTLEVATASIAGGAAPIVSGQARGSTRLASNLPAGFANTAISAAPGTLAFDANGVPTALRTNANQTDPTTGITRAANATSFSGPPPTQTYGYTQTVSQAATPAGLGTVRQGGTLTGYTGGLLQTTQYANASTDQSTSSGPVFATGGTAVIQVDTTGSKLAAAFNVVPLTRSGTGSANDFQGANYQLGGLGAGSNGRSAYVDAATYGAVDAATVNADGSTTPLSTVNGRALNLSRLSLVSADTVGASSFFPGVQFCNCEFTKWGFWSADTSRNATAGTQTYSDRGHLLTYVAGVLPDVGDIPLQGQATYAGHIVGSFNDGTNEYVAAGNFSNTVNFGAKTGAVSVTGLDNRNYAATVYLGGNALNATADPRTFLGSGATTAGGTATIALNGSFFKGSTSPVQEMGGNFFVQGTGAYLGSGIFAARR